MGVDLAEMTFLLTSDGRERDVVSAFRRYREYLEAQRDVFPPSAYTLATSDWYFDPQDHRCPHDAWLERCELIETSTGERSEKRTLSLRLRMLGAYHDGHIEIIYPRVFAYSFSLVDSLRGHCDWRFDELRISDRGNVIHEIEWADDQKTGLWIIEASDLEYRWAPLAP